MSTRKNYTNYILLAILLLSFLLFTIKAFSNMWTVPFNEFDEAHRAENARRMREYGSFFVPVSGSVQDRVPDLRIPFKQDQLKFLYFHLERPPLVYDFMILSSYLFGEVEFGYRLPSFILGMGSIIVFLLFAWILNPKIHYLALGVGVGALLTSSDLWLSSQYAQLDTGITTFLFLALLSMITFVERKKEKFLIISAIGFSLAILCKGQPAIVFLFPLLYLLITKKLSWKELLRFSGYALVPLLPWLGYIIYTFGLLRFLQIFLQFAFITNAADVIHHHAPVFWYARWWWDNLRPAWSLFLAFVLVDFVRRKIDTRKMILLIYIVGNLVLLSSQSNKLWWYVLPLIPAMCFYLYLSIRDYVTTAHLKINLAIAILIASRPSTGGAPNFLAISFGTFFTIVVFYILNYLKISDLGKNIKQLKGERRYDIVVFCALLFSLISFYFRFPTITPYHWEMKPVAAYFSTLSGDKCLWIYDVPVESVLFYSNTGEIYTYNSSAHPFGHCNNYLITTAHFPDMKLDHEVGAMKLYKF